LANSEKNFDTNNFIKKASVPVVNNTAECKIEGVPFGTYAIKFYHDKNNNKILDKDFIGIPKEEYGFSNNAEAIFGPPEFDEAKFIVNKKEIVLDLKAQ
jgi:uncharacterized protein (DUF2141 family)